MSLPRFDLHLELHRLDCLASHKNLDAYYFAKNRYEEFLKEPPPPLRLVTGEDLKNLGFLPGPLFSEIIRKVEDQILEGVIKTKDDALNYVKQNYSQLKEKP
jgi:poly(A) polymerase